MSGAHCGAGTGGGTEKGAVLKEDNMRENDMKFIQEATKSLKPGASKEFKCPICGGVAHAVRSVKNEHLWAKCSGCGFVVRE